MTASNIGVTPGTGATIETWFDASSNHQQIVRQAQATAITAFSGNNPWLVTTAGLASVIAADASRLAMILVSAANSTVYLRFDNTIPTPSATPPLYHYLLNPGDRFEVPRDIAPLAVSMVGAVAGGYVLAALATGA